MQCFALTSDKKRCLNAAIDASAYCDAHRDSVPAAGQNGHSNRLSGIFARMRGALIPPIYDGGKYEIPKWLNDAPTAQVVEYLTTHEDSMARWMACSSTC